MPFKYEGEMFEKLKDFFEKETQDSSNKFGYDIHRGVIEKNNIKTGWPLYIDRYCSPPDVYGVASSKIYLCQGKLIKNKAGNLWKLIAQCISNRKYGHFIYAFLPDQDLEELKKDKDVYTDFKDIFSIFKFGLLTVRKTKNLLSVKKIIAAKEQLITKRRILFIKQKIKQVIKNEKNLELFITKLIETLGAKPYLIKRRFLQKTQPAFYISLNKNQEMLGLIYFIKLYATRVGVGLTVYHNRFKIKLYNKIINNPNYQFVYYNKKKISDIMTKYIKIEGKSNRYTHDFYNVVENISYSQFFDSLDLKETQVILETILLTFKELIVKLDPLLNTFIL